MTQNIRHTKQLELIQKYGFVTIDELVEHFNVTPQTIRRDLNYLAEEGLIIRHHGGAGSSDSSTSRNVSYQSRKIMNLEAKELIAHELVKLIPNGASLFINIGTTTETIARALLKHQNLKVVTNNIHVATILSAKEDFTVVVAAGEVRHRDGGIIGEATRDFISQFQMDFGIIGISGINSEGSLLDFDFREVKVSQSIIENANQVILGVDHSKFGRNAMVKLGSLSQLNHLVTDKMPTDEMKQLLANSQCELHIAAD